MTDEKTEAKKLNFIALTEIMQVMYRTKCLVHSECSIDKEEYDKRLHPGVLG
jgi:hypothetical protein